MSDASRIGRLRHCVVEAGDVLAQLAHDQEAAIAKQAAEFRVAVDRLVAFAISGVGVADQHLAQVNLVRIRAIGRTAVVSRLRLPIHVAEVIDRVLAMKLSCEPLHRQQGDAGEFARQELDRLGDRRNGVATLTRRGSPTELKDRMDRLQRDGCQAAVIARRVGPQPAVAARQYPAARVVPAHVAQQPGSRRHALPELRGPGIQLCRCQPAGTQTLEREREIDELRIGGCVFAVPRRCLEPIQERGSGGRAVEGQQDHRTIGRTFERCEDATLHIIGRLRLRRMLWQFSAASGGRHIV